ncbi:hypothetical protein SLU01_09690 [Sporosarcina luteola]|uniref:Uncharacterized protein n=1 Tax=Sporosarcina luteola TaxID=582850 RepID=A0A511Z5C7_9BACL|nr:hypothetical protein SLU01_09690 [Sporosarcina luteola]
MKLLHWEYTRKYQVKGIFDEFPETVFLFRRVKDYYFLFSMSGLDQHAIPSKKDYVRMEYILNKELYSLDAYRQRKVFQ